jgi:hypothetical protein
MKTHVAHICEKKRNAYMDLVAKHEIKRQLARSRHRLMHNHKIVVEGTGWDDVNWNNLAQDREPSKNPSGSIKWRKGGCVCV